MTTFTEGVRDGEFLAFEMHPEFTREQATFASGNSIVAGQVVKGPLTAVIPALAADTTGLYLSFQNTDATAAAKKGAVVARGPVVVNGNLITYPAGTTAPQKVAINTALAAVNIIVRV